MIIALFPLLLPSGMLDELRRQSLVPRCDADLAIIIVFSSLLLPCGVILSWGGAWRSCGRRAAPGLPPCLGASTSVHRYMGAAGRFERKPLNFCGEPYMWAVVYMCHTAILQNNGLAKSEAGLCHCFGLVRMCQSAHAVRRARPG